MSSFPPASASLAPAGGGPGPDPWLLPAAALAEHLLAGGVAIFPTDTVPALAAVPDSAGRIWHLKQRPAHKPLILMGADLSQLQQRLGFPWPEPWLAMARHCWPGPITLVLPIPGPISAALNPGGSSLGLRVPGCDAARALLRLSGPLATTSVNRSGQPALQQPRQAAAAFPDLPLLGPLPWPQALGQASQVLAWSDGDGDHSRDGYDPGVRWRQLRRGPTPQPRELLG